jgi:MFS family permease
MTAVAVPVQMYTLTHSSLDLGLIGLAQLVPIVTVGLFVGPIIDVVDRRRLALITSSTLAALSTVLVIQAALHLEQVWLLYSVVAAQAGLFALDNPARGAMLPRLLTTAQLPAANALQQMGFNIGITVGPLIAGAMIGAAGLFSAYLVDAVSFGAALYALWRLPPIPPEREEITGHLASIREQFTFLASQSVVLMSFLVDIDAMLFGYFRALSPVLAVRFFHGGAGTVGLLYAAPAVGAVIGGGLSGWLGRIRRQGLAVVVSIVVFGVSVTGFGLARTLWLGLLLLAISGAADMVSAVFRNTIMQVATPDSMRGRLGAVYIAVVSGGPRLGELRAGVMASATSAAVSITAGGLACIAGVLLLAAAVPAFVRYRTP